METTREKRTLKGNKNMLQLHRKLVPIEHYARRTGVTRGVIEQCGQLGVLQLRCFRGNVFVVDVPPNISALGDDYDIEQGAGMDKEQYASKVAKLVAKITNEGNNNGEPSKLEEPTEQISQIVKETFKNQSKSKNQSRKEIDGQKNNNSQNYNELTLVEEEIDTSQKGSKEFPPVPEFDESLYFEDTSEMDGSSGGFEPQEQAEPNAEINPYGDCQSKFETGYEAEEGTKKRSRVNYVLAGLFVLSLCAVGWLFAERQSNIQKLNQATMSFNSQAFNNTANLKQELASAKSKIAELQEKLNSKQQAYQQSKNEIDSTKEQLNQVEEELAHTKDKLQSTRQRSNEIIEKLNRQIQSLSSTFSSKMLEENQGN